MEVIDDGRGIDPTAVRGKARERAIGLGEQELAAMSDEQVVELIFADGAVCAGSVLGPRFQSSCRLPCRF